MLIAQLPGRPLDALMMSYPVGYACLLIGMLFVSFCGASFLAFRRQPLSSRKVTLVSLATAAICTFCSILALFFAVVSNLVDVN